MLFFFIFNVFMCVYCFCVLWFVIACIVFIDIYICIDIYTYIFIYICIDYCFLLLFIIFYFFVIVLLLLYRYIYIYIYVFPPSDHDIRTHEHAQESSKRATTGAQLAQKVSIHRRGNQ